MKQYVPLKPKRWGFNIFVLVDSGGIVYVYDFILYPANILPVEEEGDPDLGRSSNFVLCLEKAIPHNNNYMLYLDNWITCVPLIIRLAERDVRYCGTMKPNSCKTEL